MTTRYTPTEILTAGLNEMRATFAHLYVELDQLRAKAAYYYHLAYVDIDTTGCEHGRLPFHPAPAGFGGNELTLPARPVYLNRLTPAGLELYTIGVRAGWAERAHLLDLIDYARHDLERMLDALDGTPAAIAEAAVHAADVAANRAARAQAAPVYDLTGWDDAPVRIPGTTSYTTTK